MLEILRMKTSGNSCTNKQCNKGHATPERCILVIGVAVIETALIIAGINTRPAPSPSSPVAEQARDTLTSGQ